MNDQERDQSSEDGAQLLEEVRDWLSRYIGVLREDDLDLLTLWAAHTWIAHVTYTTPRLLITSPIHGAGKTTTLEHLERFCKAPVQMSSVSSPALLTRMLGERTRTVLIDEVDRSLNPRNEGVGEIIAVINSGYKVGASRPTLIPHKEQGWVSKELPTYSPVAMAGNGPQLPDDTLSRCIPIFLAPSDAVEDSDWETIDPAARELGARIEQWAETADELARETPQLPPGVTGRGKERWRPLKRVAIACGGRWPQTVDNLSVLDMERIETEREDGIVQERPHVALLKHLAEVWPDGQNFTESKVLLDRLTFNYPDVWGSDSVFDKPLTHQRMGRMLSKNFGLQSVRPSGDHPRGYTRKALEPLWGRMGMAPPREPARPAEPAEPALKPAPGASKASNARLAGSQEGNTSAGDVAQLIALDPVPMTTGDIRQAMGWNLQRAGRAAQALAVSSNWTAQEVGARG